MTRARFIHSGLLGLACLVLSSTAIAQDIPTPDGVCVDKRGCDAQPDETYPEPPTTGDTIYDPIDPPFSPNRERLERLKARFSLVISDVRRVGVLDPAELADQSGWQTLPDLDRRSSQLFTRVAVWWNEYRSEVNRLREEIARAPEVRAEVQQRNANLRSQSAAAQSTIVEAARWRDREPHIARAEAEVLEVDDLASRVYADAGATRHQALEFVTSFMPAAERKDAMARFADWRLGFGGQALLDRYIYPRKQVARAEPQANPVASSGGHVPSVLPAIEERLEETARMNADTLTAKHQRDALAAELERQFARLAGLRAENQRLEQMIAEAEPAAEFVNRMSQREDNMVSNRATAAHNLFRAAAVDLVWQWIKERKIDPAVRDFAETLGHGSSLELAEFCRTFARIPGL